MSREEIKINYKIIDSCKNFSDGMDLILGHYQINIILGMNEKTAKQIYNKEIKALCKRFDNMEVKTC